MSDNCNGCDNSYYPRNLTWTKQSSLSPSDYNPLKSMGNWTIKENYCCGGIANTMSTAWTRAHNVTPDNSSIYHTMIIDYKPFKESFKLNNHSTYSRLSNTWHKQQPYTAN